jgi:hypothetical protein
MRLSLLTALLALTAAIPVTSFACDAEKATSAYATPAQTVAATPATATKAPAPAVTTKKAEPAPKKSDTVSDRQASLPAPASL